MRTIRGRQQATENACAPSAAHVFYRRTIDRIELVMRSGITVEIPRKLIDELAEATPAQLKGLHLSPGGEALAVRSLDVDVSVAGLLRDLFGLKLQRVGSHACTPVLRNGAKSGRTRKIA